MPERLYRIHGHVQGVGFRWWSRAEARRLGLSGTVRNCPDGSVELRARGPEEALASLRALLRQGPPRSRVSGVDEEPASGVPAEGFEIER
ncbi:MAG TPA: acylphosphatase [Longimicrobiaceae bacterium]|nr:acylphosphatase [Longimicrobiaceae bacterium]